MKILLAGLGNLGFQVATTLTEHGHDLTLMDQDPDVLRDIGGRLDCMTYTGRANNLEDLRRAQAAGCSAFLALTGSDEINIVACAQAAGEFPGITTIARISNGDYGHGRLYRSLEAGIDHFINPETSAALGILHSLVYGAASDVISFPSMDIQIRSMVIPSGSPYHGQKLQDVHHSLSKPCLVPLIGRRDTFLIPSGETTFMEGDHLYLAARSQDFRDIFEALGKSHMRLRHILLVGGTRISQVIAGYLCGQNTLGDGEAANPALRQLFGRGRVTLVESSYELCRQLAQDLPQARVIQGDLGDEDLFREEHLEQSDVVVCCSESEEHNILAGLYGKRMGIPRAVSLVSSNNYLAIARQLEIDVALSLRNAVANAVIRILRAGEVDNVQSLGDGSIELVELSVAPGARACGQAIVGLDFPPETLVVAVQRGTDSFIARGSTVLEEGDRVIILSRRQHSIRIQNLFKARDLKEA